VPQWWIDGKEAEYYMSANETLVPQLVMGYGTLAFYFGHAMELMGIVLVGIPAALDLRQGGASRPLVGDLTATELVAGEEAHLGPRVRALMIRLEGRDVSTEEHTRRVALLAAQVGEELKLSPSARRHLAVGGLLHDIGKLSVPDAVLKKPGPLTDSEWTLMRRHPEAGARILDAVPFLDRAVDVVLHHHERWDGRGYPAGLSQDEIPLWARMFSVVDTVCCGAVIVPPPPVAVASALAVSVRPSSSLP